MSHDENSITSQRIELRNSGSDLPSEQLLQTNLQLSLKFDSLVTMNVIFDILKSNSYNNFKEKLL